MYFAQKMGRIAVTSEFDKYMTLFEQIHMFVMWYSLHLSMTYNDAMNEVVKHGIEHVVLVVVCYAYAGDKKIEFPRLWYTQNSDRHPDNMKRTCMLGR